MVVDEDLIAALKSGRVAAAGLDVFEGEPKLHPGYVALKNTFLLPHIGSATVETRLAMGMLALDNIDAVLDGKPAPSLVTQEAGCRVAFLTIPSAVPPSALRLPRARRESPMPPAPPAPIISCQRQHDRIPRLDAE